ncbi:hypothetical protein D3C87_1714430 [compost metagenome]
MIGHRRFGIDAATAGQCGDDARFQLVKMKRVEPDQGRGRPSQPIQRLDTSVTFAEADRTVVTYDLDDGAQRMRLMHAFTVQ